MGDRWYDPAVGIWTQPDSLVPSLSDPLSLNRFSFVEGNPLRFTDPSGHTIDDPDCQVTNTCTNPGGTPQSGSSSGGQQPPDAQPVCAIFSCTPIGNYAVLVTACDPAGCISWVVPIPGAIPPPDQSGNGANSSEDPGDSEGSSGSVFTWAKSGGTGSGQIDPAVTELAESVSKRTGAAPGLVRTGKGYILRLVYRGRQIVIRVMSEGGNRKNYFRVSIPGRGDLTVEGGFARGYDEGHPSIGDDSLDAILNMVDSAERYIDTNIASGQGSSGN